MILSDVWHLSVWRLSVAYIGQNSRTERSRKTKIGNRGSPRHTWLRHHF